MELLRVLTKYRVRLPKKFLESVKAENGVRTVSAARENDYIVVGTIEDEVNAKKLVVNVHNQITIPKQWREELRIQVNDLIEWHIEGEQLTLLFRTPLLEITAHTPDIQTSHENVVLKTSGLQGLLDRDKAERAKRRTNKKS